MDKNARIIGTGSYLPEKRLDNQELAKRLGVESDWILQRTGIDHRNIAAIDQATSDLAVEAVGSALQSCGIANSEVDLILAATSTPESLS